MRLPYQETYYIPLYPHTYFHEVPIFSLKTYANLYFLYQKECILLQLVLILFYYLILKLSNFDLYRK